MKVVIDSFAWLRKSELTPIQLQALRYELTLYPRQAEGFDKGEVVPLRLYAEDEERFGVAREYFLAKQRGQHEIQWNVVDGWGWPGPLAFAGKLRDEQQYCVNEVMSSFMKGRNLGGLLRAVCGGGKTTMACAIIARLQVPTLVVVHKEFLMNQWRDRIAQFLPDAKVGIAQQDVCDYEGKHIVLGMIHSLSGKRYPPMFYQWPGFLIFDEAHRVGAATFSLVPPQFPARHRIGLTATPRRADGAEKVFFWHLGPELVATRVQMLKPKVRRVWTDFRLVKTGNFNPSLVPKTLILKFLCASPVRNRMIVEQLILAVRSGRKVLVLSERLKHLDSIEQLMRTMWTAGDGSYPRVGYYVGGKTEAQREEAGQHPVILATRQFAAEGLDLPALDTLFLITPMSDIEQAVGRILRPCEGKKDPIVVDFRDDAVALLQRLGEKRDRYYMKVC